MMAAQNGHVEAMALLLDRGANLEAKNKAGLTALIMAAQNGKVEAMALLLDRGADLEARSKPGKSALDFLKPKTLRALALHILHRTKHARKEGRACCAEALAAKQAEMEEALAAKQAEMEEALAAKQAEMDAQAAAAQAYRTATVAAMAALEHRVKQLEDLAQLL
ncbi:hypothetical protein FNF27_07543 [Cafeteria roenbergensis]|uniref:Uncharacterized protein n=1 Tax=Cafeteria roenbergensis TaxID=33653 RepID=A0A5A8DLV6_CAFRO|nr:hypothetical protein FNF27_07543 [Cafeteria roenbergensis]